MATLLKALNIVVNGASLEVPPAATIADLLLQLELETLMVAVEQNGEIVPKKDFDTRKLSEGDRLEVVHFVGGG